jgi:hypothetical protein
VLRDLPLDHEVIFTSCSSYTKGSGELLHDYNWLDWLDWLDWLNWFDWFDWLDWCD